MTSTPDASDFAGAALASCVISAAEVSTTTARAITDALTRLRIGRSRRAFTEPPGGMCARRPSPRTTCRLAVGHGETAKTMGLRGHGARKWDDGRIWKVCGQIQRHLTRCCRTWWMRPPE